MRSPNIAVLHINQLGFKNYVLRRPFGEHRMFIFDLPKNIAIGPSLVIDILSSLHSLFYLFHYSFPHLSHIENLVVSAIIVSGNE